MLHITKFNKSKFEIGPSKKHGLLITTERARVSPIVGQNGHSVPLFEIGIKKQKFLAKLKSRA